MNKDKKISEILSGENKYWESQLKETVNLSDLFNGLKDSNGVCSEKANQKNTFKYMLEEDSQLLSENKNIADIYLIAALCLTINKLDGRKQIVFDIPKTHGEVFETMPFIEDIEGAETIRDLLNVTKKIYVNDIANQHIDVQGLMQRKLENHCNILLTNRKFSDSANQEKKYKFVINVNSQNTIISFEAAINYLDSQELDGFGQTYANLLKIIMDPRKRDNRISDIPLVENVLEFKNDFVSDQDIASVFEKLAYENKKTAVKFKDEEISFDELNKRSNQVANMIMTNTNLSSQTYIGIMMHKSIDMIAAILGVLKLHKAYVPIDPEYPTIRKKEIIKEINLKTIYAEDSTEDIGLASERTNVLYQNHLNKYQSKLKSDTLAVTKRDDPCYVIFTSGTTGHPKPVVVTQSNVLNLISNIGLLFNIDTNARWTMCHQFSFDFSIWEIFGAILNNNTLVIVDDETTKDPKKLLSFIKKEKISVLCQTPNAFYPLAERLKNDNVLLENLKYIFFGGERLNPEKLLFLKEKCPSINFVNMYGITETTVHVTYKNLSLEDMKKRSSNIGKPIHNYHVFILNKYKNILPKGIPGEMYVSGTGVTQGYLNMPEETKEKFLQTDKGRLYKTGDYAVKSKHDDLIYLGRIDDQVEIRGHRIELQEITNALLEIPNVADAFVTVIDSESLSGPSLVAYFIEKDDKKSYKSIQDNLSKILPAYFIPSFWVPVTYFPLKSNGKIDVGKLPDPKKRKAIRETPSSPTETTVYNEWSEILNNTHIDINDDFFDVGGNSIAVTMLANRIKNDFNLEIPVSKLFEIVTIKTQSQYIDHIILDSNKKVAKEAIESKNLERREDAGIFEMSPSQKRMFIMAQENIDAASYIIPIAFVVKGNLSYQKVKDAIYALVRRHESLRTTFYTEKGKYIQKIEDFVKPDFVFERADNFSQKQSKKVISEISYPFNLKKGPLFRVRIIQTINESYVFFVIHHIVFDGESVNLLIKDFNDYYLKNSFSEPVSQYHDFSEWINKKHYKNNKLVERFKKAENQAYIITDYPRIKSKEAHISKNTSLSLDLNWSNKITAFCKENKITDFAFFTAVWEVLLSKYSNQTDVSVGFPVSGRSRLMDEHAIGMFVNTAVIRTNIDIDKNFKNLLKQVKAQITQALDAQEYPFDKLLEDIGYRSDETHNPLFDSIVSITDSTSSMLKNFCGFETAEISLPDQVSKFDLHLEVVRNLDEKKNYKLVLNYDSSLFAVDSVNYIIVHYFNLLKKIISDPNDSIKDIDMINSDELKSIDSYLGNGSQYLDLKDDFLHKLSTSIKKYPEKIAISSESGSISYSSLDKKIGNCIKLLKDNNVASGDAVALYMDRSADLLIAIYAVLSCGAFYVPIDPNYPVSRTKYIIDNSESKLVLFDDANSIGIFQEVGIKHVNISRKFSDSGIKFTNNSNINNQDSLAYIIYTSGTTGKPKGVKITRRNLAHIIKSMTSNLNITNKSKIMFKSSYCFDMSIPEIFATISNGGETYVLPSHKEGDPYFVSDKIINERITDIQFVPSLLNIFVERNREMSFPSIKNLVVGGEEFPTNLLRNCRTLFGNANIINGYGPTENTVYTTFMNVNDFNATDFKSMPIGSPIEGVALKVVDKYGNKVGIGVPGKLMISGKGLFSGYLGRDDLTELVFDNQGFYNSNDLVRINASMTIEFLGRIDNQIKVRGYRIELDEVKNAIETIVGVKQVVLNTYKENKDNILIVAYVVLEKNTSLNEVKSRLIKLLPNYMVPGVIRQVKEVPLTFNGKVNKDRLEESVVRISTKTEALPRNETERKLIELYGNITRFDDIDISSNFFEIGGQSLSVIKLQQLIEETFNKKVELADIFEHPVIKDLANIINKAATSVSTIIPTSSKRKIFPVTDGQKEIFVADRVQNSKAFNVYVSLKVKNLDIAVFKLALENVLNKYEVLSARFQIDSNGYVTQTFIPRLKINDVIQINKEKYENKEEIKSNIEKFINKKFELLKGKLFKVQVLLNDDNDTILTFCMHHIISDAWSLRVLIQELFNCYVHHLSQETNKINNLRFQYKDYVVWKKSNKKKIKDNYWKNAFKNIDLEKSRMNMLPKDVVLDKPQGKEKTGSSVSSELPKNVIEAISDLQRELGVSKLNLYFTAVILSIYSYTKNTDIVIGTSLSGRENKELENQVGYFVNTLPLVCKIDENLTVREFVIGIANNFYNLMKHQNETEAQIVSDLNLNTNRNGKNYFYDIMVQSINNDSLIKLEKDKDLNIEVIPVDNGTLKHDLTFSFSQLNDVITIAVDYSNQLYNKGTIMQEIELISKLLVEMNTDIDQKIVKLVKNKKTNREVIPKINL